MICVPLTNPCIFEPPISSPDKEEEEEGGNGDKIRVHAFTEVVRILRKQSNDKNTDECPSDMTVQIPSRRSLLALQLGVWTTLQRLVPMVSGRGDSIQSSDQRNYIELINTLISSSKSTSLLLPRPSSCETHFLDWSYSRADVMIHSLLLLRTKMAVAGLFTDIISSSDGSKGTVSVGLIHGMNGLAMGPSINLALMAVEAAKHPLFWDRNDSEDSQSETDIPSQFSRELEHSMGSMSSWAVSNFMALAVLFPDIEDKSTVWSNSFPHLMECIPITANSSNGCLRKVMVRIIHAMLANSERLSSNHLAESLSIDDSFNTISFIDQFKNQCLVRGYFSHLFGLVKDSSESVSSTAVSIVVLLLESFSDSISEALLETTCSDAVGSLEDRFEPADLDPSKDSPLVRLGSKRRKLVLGKEDKGSISYGASIQSAFTHAVSDALDDAQIIMTRLTEGNKHPEASSKGAPEVVSLVPDSETLLLRNVAGTLRVLLSFQVCGSETGLTSFTDVVIARLFECMKVVSRGSWFNRRATTNSHMSSQDCFNPPSYRLWPLDCMPTVH